MTGQQIVYLAIVVALFGIVLFAFWRGNPFSVRVDKGSFTVDGKGRPVKPDPTSVNVLTDADLQDVEAGAITGVKGAPAAETRIDVLEGATITRGKFGDITGRDSSATPPKD